MENAPIETAISPQGGGSARKPDESEKNLDEVLALIRRNFNVSFEPLNVDGAALETLAINNMPSHIDKLVVSRRIRDPLRDLPLWAKIWPASLILGRFLRKCQPEGKTMLEIGAGMGACSLIAAGLGFKSIVATDLNGDALNFARANVLRNGYEKIVNVRPLDIRAPWSDAALFDIIAASEMLYLDDLHRPLLKFIDRRLAENGRACLCSDLARAKPRFKKLAEKYFRLTEGHIGVKSMEEGREERRIYNMLILERK